jgi:hypothetical protein
MTIDEIGKALLTMLGTLIVAAITARLTVGLALGRFKQERLWDKRLQIYSDLVEALSEMYRTDSILHDFEQEYPRNDSPDRQKYEQEVVDRFKKAKQQVESTAATAKLILTPEVEAVLDEYFSDIQNARNADTYTEHLEMELYGIRKARDAILELGRKSHNA